MMQELLKELKTKWRHQPTSRRPGPGCRVRFSRALLPSALLPALATALLVAGCGDGGGEGEVPAEPLVAFDTTRVRIETDDDTIPLTVELAETDAQRQYGLMERAELAADRGMLFLYPEPKDSTAGFWMYRTLIPLDIAFLDGGGGILDIQTMQPCTSPNPRTCRLYGPDVPFQAALEMNARWFDEHGVEVGDRVAWPEAG